MDQDFHERANRLARVALMTHNRAMLSKAELSSSQINAEVAREAYAHASAMLDDVLQNRKDIEQKCFIPVSYTHLTLPTKRIV